MSDIAGFRHWLRERRYSENTIRDYLGYVRRAHDGLGSLRGRTPDELAAWTAALTDSAARNARKALLAWYEHRGVKVNPARGIPVTPAPRGLPRPLTTEERVRFLLAAEALGGPHRVLGYAFACTGARFSEVRTAHWSAFTLDGPNPEWLIRGKGANRSGPKQRLVPLHPRLRDILTEWKALHLGSSPVFPSPLTPTRPLNERSLRETYYAICDEAGIGRVVPHRHRHSVATLIHETTGDIATVMAILGHESAATSMIYTLPSTQRRRDAIDGLALPDEAA